MSKLNVILPKLEYDLNVFVLHRNHSHHYMKREKRYVTVLPLLRYSLNQSSIRSILNETGLFPSVQQSIIVFSSFIQLLNSSVLKLPPRPRTATTLLISFHAQSQKFCGFSKRLPINSCPSIKNGYFSIVSLENCCANSEFNTLFRTLLIKLLNFPSLISGLYINIFNRTCIPVSKPFSFQTDYCHLDFLLNESIFRKSSALQNNHCK